MGMAVETNVVGLRWGCKGNSATERKMHSTIMLLQLGF